MTSSRGATEIKAEKIVIATGTKPAASPKVPINARTIINSDQILEMPALPAHADRGRRRRHRGGVHLHVRDARRASHVD